MKKSHLGVISFIFAVGSIFHVLVLWCMSHFKLITYGKNFGSAIYEMVAGSVILVIPAVLVLAIVAFAHDHFAIKSYSFLSFWVALGAPALLFLLP